MHRYGIEDVAQPSFARNCLLARRLVERGVRFVQLFHGDWDHHSTSADRAYPANAARPTSRRAALVSDLAARGLLGRDARRLGRRNGPLVRGPGTRNATVGRDHNIDAFTMWLAGGGIKPGRTIGATDDFGCFAAHDSYHIYDLQASILHCWDSTTSGSPTAFKAATSG